MNWRAVVDGLSRMDAETAEAFKPEDRDSIFKAIRETVGFQVHIESTTL